MEQNEKQKPWTGDGHEIFTDVRWKVCKTRFWSRVGVGRGASILLKNPT
jgi:hypothetical protein